ncbi:hypothetical protein FN846DRAFT_772101 [Sphaerosporella brunnea]|uniref:Restriction of telomere capping protein 1 n=1 Tax=Sphaerosporella brunnea TaxID=1250544 RepID=A0A5J5F918_9PEZI|nr:hypothetical protein FN846DRAFT_772101 [Sphaerosporella brunnea]
MADSLYQQYSLLSANPAPPPQHTQSRKAVFARLAQPFIGASRPPSSHGPSAANAGGGGGGGSSVTSAPILNGPRNLRYNLNSPILALSANSEGDRIVVAGREILRILRVGYNEITEEANLRLPGEQKRHFQYDVKWGTSPQKNIIATAGTNGTICLYDVKEGKLDRMLREHGRQVHRLAFNQANGNLLLSASQDGTIKLWDLRERRSRHTFNGKAEAVRDVQFNAGNAVEFAGAFDSGAVQKWDYRKENICEKKINAHNGPAFAVDWHPDGKHLASGGRDRTVKIWDMSADSRRKPKHELTTMASVSRIAWRPSRSGKHDSTQLATCAINNDHRVQLWDFKRPYIPPRIMDVHDNPTTGLQWKDEDILWSCAKDSTLVQSDVPFAMQPINHLSHGAFDWAPNGEFTFAAQRRAKNRHHGVTGSRTTFDTDEDIAIREERRSHRSGSFKGSKPNLTQINVFDTPLDKFVPSQSAAKVSIPSLFDKEAFDFFAERYIIDLDGVAGGPKITLAQACEHNARIAFRAHKYRTAKSWKMIQLVLASEDAEAEKWQLKRPESISSTHHASGIVARRTLGLNGDNSATASGGATPKAPPSPASAPTPTPGKLHPEPLEHNLLSLPPAAFGRSLSSSTISTDGEHSGVAGSDSDTPSHSRKKARPVLTVDTSSPNFIPSPNMKSRDFAASSPPPKPPTTNGNAVTHTKRDSIDSNQNLPLFTSTTERSDPLSSQTPAGVDIAPASKVSSNSSSPVLQRQFSLVSEQTSSSYGVLESVSEGAVPHSLPPITEEAAGISQLLPPPPPIISVNPPPTLVSNIDDPRPWAVRRLAQQLIEYCTATGDVQFAGVLVLLLHKRLGFAIELVEEILDGYLNLLTRLQHFSVAALVRKLAPAESLRMAGQWNVDVDLSCGQCYRAVGGRGGGWCEKCAGSGGAECVICGEVGKGRRWTVCAVCGHGGCEGCLRGWFLGVTENGDEKGVQGEEWCPAVGCGCCCLPR